MIQIGDKSANGVVVAEATGRVSADDYEHTLIPAVDAASAQGHKVRLLYVLSAEFEGYDPAAALDDAKMGLHLWGSFDKIGLVTDNDTYAGLAKALGFLMPGEFRVFPLAERDVAEAWVTADE